MTNRFNLKRNRVKTNLSLRFFVFHVFEWFPILFSSCSRCLRSCLLHSDVCNQHRATFIGAPLLFATQYQCYNDEVYQTQWLDLNASGKYEIDCTGEPSDGPSLVTSFDEDDDIVCDGVWNCPYATVRYDDAMSSLFAD